MTTKPEDKPRRLKPEDLVEQQLENELMLFDPARNKAFCLNRTAAFVWKNADGESSVEEIAERMRREVNEPASRETVDYALSLLEKDGLMEAFGPAAPHGKAVTRRDLLRKIGIGAIPMITVLLIHPAKAHASSLPGTNGSGGGSPAPGNPPGNPPGSPMTDGSHHGGGIWQWLIDLFQ